MRAARPVTRPLVAVDSAPTTARPNDPGEIIYRGYRVEPESYRVNNTAWAPRVVVSVRTQEGGWRRTPLYSTDTAKFPSREEADGCAVGIAKAWIDTTIEREPSTDGGPGSLGEQP